MIGRLFIVVILSMAIVPTHSFYELTSHSLLNSCPFNRNDPFHFDGLLSMLRSQVQAKVDDQKRCMASFNHLIQNLNVVDDLFLRVEDPKLKEEITNDVLQAALVEVEMELAQVKSTILSDEDAIEGTADPAVVKNHQFLGERRLYLTSQKNLIEEQLRTNKISNLYNLRYFEQSQETKFRSKLFNHGRNIVNTLANMDPSCVDHLGGWSQLLPTVLSVTSVASGYNSFANQEIIGSSLNLLSTLPLLWQSLPQKKSIKDIVEVHNRGILACTYYSIKYAACEYRRAYRMSQDADKILKLLNQIYQENETGEYEEFFTYIDNSIVYSDVFNNIAGMGSALTLDLNLLFKYINARRVNPEAIVVIDNNTSNDNERTRWLNEVRIAGVEFKETDNTGTQISKKAQVDQAILDINSKIADISSAEAVLLEKRSFVDLRHDMDAKFPNFRFLNKRFIAFLEKQLNSTLTKDNNQGAVLAFKILLARVDDFLSIEVKKFPDYEDYVKEVNLKGTKLFNAMADGAVAQISQQTVLAIGAKASERMSRALAVLENAYNRRSFSTTNPEENNFVKFKREKQLSIQVASNYYNYRGSDNVYKLRKIETMLKSFTKSFGEEVRDDLREALAMDSEFLPEQNDVDAAHLCALYGDVLKLNYSGRGLLKKCKKRFSSLELDLLIKPYSQKIDYDDSCFYVNYSRQENTQRILSKVIKDDGSLEGYKNWEEKRTP